MLNLNIDTFLDEARESVFFTKLQVCIVSMKRILALLNQK